MQGHGVFTTKVKRWFTYRGHGFVRAHPHRDRCDGVHGTIIESPRTWGGIESMIPNKYLDDIHVYLLYSKASIITPRWVRH